MNLPQETDIWYARLGFPTAQAVLGAGVPLRGSQRRATLGWHGTATDAERGSFALVRRDGPLEELVGERVRITVLLPAGEEILAYAYVLAPADIAEDVSVPRRLFLELAALSSDEVPVLLEVMT